MPVLPEDGSSSTWSGLPGIETAVALGRVDERERDAVLHRPGGVTTLEFGEDGDVGLGRERADVDDGCLADEIEYRGVARHYQAPPATAGSSVISSSLATEASTPPR